MQERWGFWGDDVVRHVFLGTGDKVGVKIVCGVGVVALDAELGDAAVLISCARF